MNSICRYSEDINLTTFSLFFALLFHFVGAFVRPICHCCRFREGIDWVAWLRFPIPFSFYFVPSASLGSAECASCQFISKGFVCKGEMVAHICRCRCLFRTFLDKRKQIRIPRESNFDFGCTKCVSTFLMAKSTYQFG